MQKCSKDLVAVRLFQCICENMYDANASLPEEGTLQALALNTICKHLSHSKESGKRLFSGWATDSNMPVELSTLIVTWASQRREWLCDILVSALLSRGVLCSLPLKQALCITDKTIARYSEEKICAIENVGLSNHFLEIGGFMSKLATSGGSLMRFDGGGHQDVEDGMIKAIAQSCEGKLEILILDDCLQLTGAFLERVATCCPRLSHLSLNNCANVSDQSIQAFLFESKSVGDGVLECLELAGVDFGSLSAQALSMRGRHLQSLVLDGCRGLTDAGLRSISSACPQLQNASILRCGSLTSHGAWHLTKHPALFSLKLSLIVSPGTEPIRAILTPAEREVAEAPRMFTCHRCTYDNVDVSSTSVCAMCGALRLPTESRESVLTAYPLSICDSKTLRELHIDLMTQQEAEAVVHVSRLGSVLPGSLKSLTVEVGEHSQCQILIDTASINGLLEHCSTLDTLCVRGSMSGWMGHSAIDEVPELRSLGNLINLVITSVSTVSPSLLLAEVNRLSRGKLKTLQLGVPTPTETLLATGAGSETSSDPLTVEFSSMCLETLIVCHDSRLGSLTLRCPSLTHLDVTCCGLSSLDTTGCVEEENGRTYGTLKTLRVAGCLNLDEANIVSQAKVHTGLTSLDASISTSLTDSGLQKIMEYCPRLNTLVLSGCRNISLDGIAASRLAALTISHSKSLTATVLAGMAALPRMRSLCVSNCTLRGVLSGAGAASIKEAPAESTRTDFLDSSVIDLVESDRDGRASPSADLDVDRDSRTYSLQTNGNHVGDSDSNAVNGAINGSEEQSREGADFASYVNTRLEGLAGKKGRGSVTFSASYSSTQRDVVRSVASSFGFDCEDWEGGQRVVSTSVVDTPESDEDTPVERSLSSKQGEGSFLQGLEVAGDAKAVKRLEQLARLLPVERGGTRVVCLRYQKGMCPKKPLECEYAHFQANLHKIGRSKILLDLVQQSEGSKKGLPKQRRRSDSAETAAVMTTSAVQDNGVINQRARGGNGSFGSAAEAMMPTLYLHALQVLRIYNCSELEGLVGVKCPSLIHLSITNCRLLRSFDIEAQHLTHLDLSNCPLLTGWELRRNSLANLQVARFNGCKSLENKFLVSLVDHCRFLLRLEIISASEGGVDKPRQMYPGGKRDGLNSDRFSRNKQKSTPLEKGRPKLVVIRTKNQLAASKR